MKLENVYFSPTARVVFTRREADLLTHCSQAHYDSVCRAESNSGGTIFSFNNYYKGQVEMEVALTPRKVDTFVKILEMSYLYFREPQDLVDARVLSAHLANLLRSFSRLTPEPVTAADKLLNIST